jgi:hypothetical protein
MLLFEATLSFEDKMAADPDRSGNRTPGTEEGRQEVDPCGLGAGETLGDGVPLGVRRGRGNSSASSSSSSIGEERKRCFESRMSGTSSSVVVVSVDDADECEVSLKWDWKIEV